MDIDIQSGQATGLQLSRIFDNFGRPRIQITYVDRSKKPKRRNSLTVDPFFIPQVIVGLIRLAAESSELQAFPSYMEPVKKELDIFFSKK